jgi:O-antigen/teichoic acid export membrane protein
MALNLRERIRYFRQHRFVQNFAILQFGYIGNIIQALVGVFLVRILKPELYGIYSLSFALAGLMSIVLGLGAQDAVTTIVSETYARGDKEGTRQAFAFLVWSTVILGMVAVAGALCAPFIASHFYHNSLIGSYAMVIVFASILSSLFYSFSILALQVVNRYKAMTALGLLDQISRTGLSLLFVLLGLGVLGAVLGHLVGAAIVLVTSVILWESIRRSHPILPSLRTLLRTKNLPIKKYLGFSFWVALDRNIANLYNILPVLITGVFVTTTQVTYFKLAFGYINLAVLTLLSPIATILSVDFPKMKVMQNQNLARNFVRVSLYSLGISLVLTVLAILVSPIAFHILYSHATDASIPYVYGLVIYGGFIGIGVGLGPMWRAINQVKTSILINLTTLAIGIPLGFWLIKSYALWGTVIIVTLWYTVSHVFSFFYLANKLKKLETQQA